MKRFSVLSLVVGVAMVFSFAGSGCKNAEQSAEAPKPAEQAQAPAASAVVEGFDVTNGILEKGGLGFVLSSNKPAFAVALKKTEMSYKNVMTVKCQIRPQYNGFIVFGEIPGRIGRAGLRIPAKTAVIEGPFLAKVEIPFKFDKNRVYDTELSINLAKKTIVWKVDGKELKTNIKVPPASINYVGYAIWNNKTEFSELHISGD